MTTAFIIEILWQLLYRHVCPHYWKCDFSCVITYPVWQKQNLFPFCRCLMALDWKQNAVVLDVLWQNFFFVLSWKLTDVYQIKGTVLSIYSVSQQMILSVFDMKSRRRKCHHEKSHASTFCIKGWFRKRKKQIDNMTLLLSIKQNWITGINQGAAASPSS